MHLSSSTSNKIHSIILTPSVLFFAKLHYRVSNHVYGNVFMNKIIKWLSISMTTTYVLCLLNHVQQMALNPSGNVQASSICYRQHHDEFIFGYDVDEASFSRTCYHVFDHFSNESKTRRRNLNFDVLTSMGQSMRTIC
jgi:hypothetical protein